jgi:hypothetical protein
MQEALLLTEASECYEATDAMSGRYPKCLPRRIACPL